MTKSDLQNEIQWCIEGINELLSKVEQQNNFFTINDIKNLDALRNRLIKYQAELKKKEQRK